MTKFVAFFTIGIALLFAFFPTAWPSKPKEHSEGTACTDDTWTPTSTANAPTPRSQHAAVWTGTEMIVWGGQSNSGSGLNTGGKYNPGTDSWMATSTNIAPLPRFAHTAIWTGSQMIVWGGETTNIVYLNTGGKYSYSTDSWVATATNNAPAARIQHTAVWTGSEMIVWGGYGGMGSDLNTGGRYNPVTDTWTPISTANAPEARTLHTAVWTGGEMIVWGGFNKEDGTNLSTGGRYNPTTDTWTPISTVGAPSPRNNHKAVWTGTEMIVWGGHDQFDPFYPNIGGRYNPTTDTWTPMSVSGVPLGREAHTAIWTGGEMIVWGGYNGSYLNTGGRYVPNTDQWLPTSISGAPVGRAGQTAIWTGNEMIIWGGSTFDNTGGRYCAQSTPTPTPTVTSAVSRKTHGGAGSFDVDLPLTGTPGIECRTGGATNDYTMVITFSGNVTVNGDPQAAVTSGMGAVGSDGKPNGGMVFVSGNIVTIPLTNIINVQTINVTLFSVNGSGNVVIPMGVLVGDVNGNRTVNAADVAQTKSRIGQSVNATNFRADVSAGGSINAADVAIVKANIGTGLP